MRWRFLSRLKSSGAAATPIHVAAFWHHLLGVQSATTGLSHPISSGRSGDRVPRLFSKFPPIASSNLELKSKFNKKLMRLILIQYFSDIWGKQLHDYEVTFVCHTAPINCGALARGIRHH